MSEFNTVGDPLTDIPALIEWRGNGVTFVELLRYIPYLNGELAYGLRDTNVVYWHGVSEQCVEALISLVNAGVIRLTPTIPLTYFIDGAALKLPLAKSERKYVKPHWAPITFSLPRRAA